MKTQRLSIKDLSLAADLLKQGEILAFPTETVYGLGAPIFNEAAIASIYSAKGRPSDNPLIAHIASIDDVHRIACDIPESFFRLAAVFFPGPLTVILKRHPDVPKSVSAGLDTIALRLPAHPLARELIQLVGEPLVAPSANLSGRPSATTADHVLEDFEGKIAAVLDGGACDLGIESTVISLCGEPTIYRLGAITQEQLEQALGRPIARAAKNKETAPSPGMKYRHYAPKAPLKLFHSWEELALYLNANPKCRRLLLSNDPSVTMACDTHPLTSQELYFALRLADQKGYAEILAFCDPIVCSNAALMDRLTTAAASL